MKLRWLVVVSLLAVLCLGQVAVAHPGWGPGRPVAVPGVGGVPVVGSPPTLVATVPLEPLIISTSLSPFSVRAGGAAVLAGVQVVSNAPGREWSESVRYDPVAQPEPGGYVGTFTLTVG